LDRCDQRPEWCRAGLGGVLLKSELLPGGFAYAVLALAVGFALLGFAGLLVPAENSAVVILLASQELWILGAAVAPAASRSQDVVQ
jgi:hypothetical protein